MATDVTVTGSVKLQCSKCDAEMEATEYTAGTLVVEPCADCLRQAYEDGYAQAMAEQEDKPECPA